MSNVQVPHVPHVLRRDGLGEVSLLVVFADLTRFSAETARRTDAEVASALFPFYERVRSRVADAGGTVVKFMGDAALVVFEEEDVDRGVVAVLALKDEVDAHFEELGWDSRLVVKAHFGPLIAGTFGGSFDVLGRTVNTAAMLESTGVALSVAAFRKLAPETRQRFKKHTPEVTYIRLEDPHRSRRR
jgi:class 3 adenylate cyclase